MTNALVPPSGSSVWRELYDNALRHVHALILQDLIPPFMVEAFRAKHNNTMRAYTRATFLNWDARINALVFGSNQAIGTGSAYNSTNININIYNQFRATPTYSKTTGGNGYTWVVYVGSSGVATASPTVAIASDSNPNYCLRLYVQNCHNSLTAGQAVWALTHDGGGEQIVFSAEL